MMHYGRILLLVLLSSAFLTACEQKKVGGESPAVAKVDGSEITTQQVSYAISRIGNIPKDKEAEAGKQVLKGLVDQQILVKQAIEKKLDHNPNILQAIEASKNQILAQAVLEQLAQQITKPTDTEVHDYFVKSTDLFANRRIYKLGEISIVDPANNEKAKQLISSSKDLEEFAVKLHNEGIAYKTASAVKAAEEIPLALLAKLAKMAKGEVAILPAGDSLSLLQLQDFREQPLAEEQAKPAIVNFLFEEKRKALYEAEMKKLRDVAKIEYLGAYTELGKAQQKPAAAQPAMVQPAPAQSAPAPSAPAGK